MRAGLRTDRIIIERAGASTDDGYTTREGEFATHLTLMAEVKYGRGDERRAAAQEGASLPATFIVAWSPATVAVTVRDRIQFGGAWDIENVAPRGREAVEITATRSA